MADKPIPASGHMPFAGHRTQAELGGASAPTVLAMFQPQRETILIVVSGSNPAGVELNIAEARSIHLALGQALKLAGAVEWPMEAVEG